MLYMCVCLYICGYVYICTHVIYAHTINTYKNVLIKQKLKSEFLKRTSQHQYHGVFGKPVIKAFPRLLLNFLFSKAPIKIITKLVF